MRDLCLFLLLGLAWMATEGDASKVTCQGKERGNFQDFKGVGFNLFIPCKYWALKRQVCGKWRLTFSPTNEWFKDNYYVMSYWLGVTDTVNNKEIEVRTTNKILAKHFNSNGAKKVFNDKGGNMTQDEAFTVEFAKNGVPDVIIKASDDAWELRLNPWDYNSRNRHPHSSWKFTCNDYDRPVTDITTMETQLCGCLPKSKGDAVSLTERAKQLGIGKNHRDLAVYHDILMSDAEQTDGKCVAAVDTFQNMCTDQARRLEVLKHCASILWRPGDTECITLYQCHPMDTFNACLEWGCKGDTAFDKKEKDLCEKVGEGIDLCGQITGAGNITGLVQDTNCFKDYLVLKEVDFSNTIADQKNISESATSA